MIRSRHMRAVALCLTLSLTLSLTRGAAAQIMPAPAATPNASSGTALADWNVTYRLPAGWRVGQSIGRLQMIVSNTEAGMIFLAPGLYSTPQEAIADLSAFYQQMQMQAYPIEQPTTGTIAGLRSISAIYGSADQMGRMVQGRYIALLTPHGTGVSIVAMTTPDKMPTLRATVDGLAASVKAGPPVVNNQAVAALAGQWILYNGNPPTRVGGETSNSHEETLTFDGRGSFRWSSTTQVRVSPVNPGGSSGGMVGSATSDGDQGTYTVLGNTLVYKGTKGQLAVDFQLGNGELVSGGKRYLRQ